MLPETDGLYRNETPQRPKRTGQIGEIRVRLLDRLIVTAGGELTDRDQSVSSQSAALGYPDFCLNPGASHYTKTSLDFSPRRRQVTLKIASLWLTMEVIVHTGPEKAHAEVQSPWRRRAATKVDVTRSVMTTFPKVRTCCAKFAQENNKLKVCSAAKTRLGGLCASEWEPPHTCSWRSGQTG